MTRSARLILSPFAVYPLWSILGIVGGLTIALVLMPEERYWAPRALRWPAFWLTAGLAAGPLLAALRNPAAALRAEHMLLFGLFYWILLDPIQGAYGLVAVDVPSIRNTLIAIATFAVALWVGSWMSAYVRAARPFPAAAPRSDLHIEFLFYAGLLGFVAGSLRYWAACHFNPVCIYDSFFLERMDAPWRTAEFGPIGTVLQHLRYAAFLTLPLAAALRAVEGRMTWRSWILVVLGTVFLVISIRDGGRRQVGAIVGATAMAWVLLRHRIGWQHLVRLGIIAGALLLLMQAMVAWRGVGFGLGLTQGLSLETTGRTGIAVDRNWLYINGLMTAVPERHEHTGLYGAVWTLSAPLPSSVAPWKVDGKGIDLPALMGLEFAPGYAWTCSGVGDLYLIAGWPGVVLGGLLFGVLAHRVSRLLLQPVTVRRRLLFAVMVMVLFLSLRALHNGVLTAFSVLALYGLLVMREAVLRRVSPWRSPVPQLRQPAQK